MRDFGAAVGLAFAIEGLLMAGFTESMRKRMAAAAREDPAKLRGDGPRRGAGRRRDRLGVALAALRRFSTGRFGARPSTTISRRMT